MQPAGQCAWRGMLYIDATNGQWKRCCDGKAWRSSGMGSRVRQMRMAALAIFDHRAFRASRRSGLADASEMLRRR